MQKFTYPEASAGPSISLWKTCPVGDFLLYPQQGRYFMDHFTKGTGQDVAAAQSLSQFDGWDRYTGATGGSVISDAAERDGVVTLESTTDNEGAAMRRVSEFKIDQGEGKFWFEARIRALNITDAKFGFFLGLVEAGAVAATLPLTTSDALSDNNMVGFLKNAADGDQVDTVYKANGVTAVTVAEDAATLAAATFIKLGMYFDGVVLRFFADGVELADTKTIPAADGTDFPNDVNMGIVFALMLAHGDTGSVAIDWVRAAQERTA